MSLTISHLLYRRAFVTVEGYATDTEDGWSDGEARDQDESSLGGFLKLEQTAAILEHDEGAYVLLRLNTLMIRCALLQPLRKE